MNDKSLKRIQTELKDMKASTNEYFDAFPLDNDMYKWYFVLVGPKDTDYEGGYYMGMLLLSQEYPHTAPNIQMITPTGRFDTNKNICMSNTAYHRSEWTPIWNLRTMLMGFLSVFTDFESVGISHITTNPDIRKSCASKSIEFNKINYMNIWTKFKFVDNDGNIKKTSLEPINEQTPMIIEPVLEQSIPVLEQSILNIEGEQMQDDIQEQVQMEEEDVEMVIEQPKQKKVYKKKVNTSNDNKPKRKYTKKAK